MNPPSLTDLAKPAPLQSLLNDLVYFVDRQEMPDVADLVTFWLNQAKDETWKAATEKIYTKGITAHHKTEIRKLYANRFSVSEISIMYNIPESRLRPIINNVERNERI